MTVHTEVPSRARTAPGEPRGGERCFTPVELHRIPDSAIPREPRLGGACVPVPADRLVSLARSGPAVLGLPPGLARTGDFTASVFKELRALVHLPDDHSCVIVPVPPRTVRRLLAREGWAVDHGAVPGPLDHTERPSAVRGPDGWAAADLSRTSWPLDETVLGELDVAVFCPSWLLGVVPGSTVLTLSARAAAAARAREAEGPFSVRALLESDASGAPRPSASDLMMFAHGVRTLAESHPERVESEAEARLELVADHTAGRTWLAGSPYRAGRDLAAVLPTTLTPASVRELAEFLEARSIVYGLADPARPTALSVGLSRAVPDDDLVRLLRLLDVLLGEAR
ncbi:hypothetical protein GCM10007079_41600 [Nocardiopsis terrae]|uniref:Uncharacterized protein n=1 Tax=Nocardiopsis terrae TaxID=372655 RepID=A0ABR9HM04_9ACTN|nr:hypothetical protein [Nocardiopsis terrae]MBE1460022.1 hypothetical protein [Nocardiopsis terrae]GHC92873.1 hypothetical protein GCM10007079_41600 [Nocardiopsis terrae]